MIKQINSILLKIKLNLYSATDGLFLSVSTHSLYDMLLHKIFNL